MGLKTIYNNKELTPGIRQYLVDYIQSLDKVLTNLEQAGITIARAKSQFCQAGIKIVRYICNTNGRYLDTLKVLKIMDWPKYIDITSASAFLGVCVYY